ncbi:MFS transporter [Streptomyces triculaminicus]|uniref:MFS transporter n=1 Tax=Streptomyces triculaminicus TaxID=2816232 RepID=UPI00378C91E3
MTAPAREAGARDFAGLWAAYAVSNLADGLVVITFPLIALTLTSSPGLVAGVKWAQTLPYVLCTLLIGVLIDRVERGRLILAAHVLRVAALVLLALAVAGDAAPLPALYATAFLLGTAEIAADLCTSSVLPMVVGRDRLDTANSRLESTRSSLNEFVGPPLGGLLVAAGTTVAVLGTAGAYLVAAGALLLLFRGPYPPPRAARDEPVLRSLRSELAEGLRFLWRHRLLRGVAGMVCVMAGAWSAWTAVLVLYAVAPGPMGLSGTGYGLLLTTLAVGGVLGSLAAGRVQRAIGVRNLLAVDVITSVIMLATPALTSQVWAVGAATLLGGVGSGLWNVTVVTLRQRLIPDALLGRVSSASRMIGWGGMPVGAALAGLLAQVSGPRTVFALGALACALLLIPFLTVLREDTLRAALAAADRAPEQDQPDQDQPDQDRPDQG